MLDSEDKFWFTTLNSKVNLSPLFFSPCNFLFLLGGGSLECSLPVIISYSACLFSKGKCKYFLFLNKDELNVIGLKWTYHEIVPIFLSPDLIR